MSPTSLYIFHFELMFRPLGLISGQILRLHIGRNRVPFLRARFQRLLYLTQEYRDVRKGRIV